MAEIKRKNKYGNILKYEGTDPAQICLLCKYHEWDTHCLPCLTCTTTIELDECYEKDPDVKHKTK